MREVTEWLLILTVAVLLAYDVLAIRGSGPEASISYVLRDWSRREPAIPFALGFALGHILWPR